MEKQKFLDAEGLKYLYKNLSLKDYPNNETLVAVINAIDETKADKKEPIFTGELTTVINDAEKIIATQEYVDNYFSTFGMNVYRRPETIPLTECMQIIFYAACAGTITFTLEGQEFSQTLTSSNDTGWYLWVQTDEVSGSFISPSGTRKYLNMGAVATEASVSFTPSTSYSNPSYIVITTK